MDRGMLRLGNRTSNLSCAPSSLCFCISISVTADSPLPPWLCTMQANFLHAFGHGIRDFGDAGCNGHTHTSTWLSHMAHMAQQMHILYWQSLDEFLVRLLVHSRFILNPLQSETACTSLFRARQHSPPSAAQDLCTFDLRHLRCLFLP